MKEKPVVCSDPVCLLGAGSIGADDLALAMSLAPICVAADGGAVHAIAAGLEMAAVIGDMDSITPEVLAQIPRDRVHRVAEQSSTDFDKALRHISAPVVIAVGFAGGRIDHQMAAFHTMLARADQPCVLLGAQEVVFVCPPRIELPTRAGDVVSLFPMAPVTGRSDGLEWPIAGLSFDPARQIGTSNRALGRVTLEMDAPGMLCLLPRSLIQPVVRGLGLLTGAALWPARAELHRDQPQP